MTHVVVVGAYGSAGAVVADELAGADDVELTLVDDGDPGGGLCILRGCMPSKEVLSAAAHRYQARHDDRLVGALPEVDTERVVARKDEHTSNWAAHRRAAVADLTERDGVEFAHDPASFVPAPDAAENDWRIRVADRELDPDYVVVATGSSQHVPDLDGIDDVSYMTSDDVLDATELPDSGVVMGFGYIGVELAPYLAENGVDLTVIEHDDRPLDEADPAYGDELLSIYRDDFGIDVRTNTTERRLEPTDDGGVRLLVDKDGTEGAIEADQLFLFTGRRPNVDGLGLVHTALSPGPDWVDATMQSRDDDRVFVVGDANGREPILHVAKEQGQVAAENVRRDRDGRPLVEYENVHHHVIFSALGVYPYARVGHSETSARDAGLEFVAATRRAADDGVFRTKDVPDGLATLVVGTVGTILGYQGLHYHADAMAKTMQVLVERGDDVFDVPDRAYHPTTPELIDGLLRDAKRQLRDE